MALSLRPPAIVTARLASRHRRSTTKAPVTVSIPNPNLNCQHFQSCSGCSQEMNLDRPHVLQDAEKFFKDLGLSDFTFDAGKLWEWRCRAKLAVRGTSENPLIGLYEEGTHNVVDIPMCRAHHPSINAAVDLLREGISRLNIQPYDEDSGNGELRYVQMAVTTYNTSLPVAERYQKGKVQIALVWNSEHSQSSKKLNALSNFLWRDGGPSSETDLIHSIWVNFQISTSNVIFGDKWIHLLGERDFWERVGGIDISLDPSSFGQANTQAFNSLLRRLQKYVPYGSSVIDLYAGAGIIGLSVAASRKCRSVKCVEINKESELSFEKSLNRLPKTIDCNISWHNTDASFEPLHWLEGCDVVVVDPPRKGLHPSLKEALLAVAARKGVEVHESFSLNHKPKDEKRPWVLRAREASIQNDSKADSVTIQSWPNTLIYISCGWDSFKEDCRNLLSTRRWRLEKAHAFNFFPGTQSIEVLAVFKRGAQAVKKKKKVGKKKKS